jgi:hypothetical protein
MGSEVVAALDWVTGFEAEKAKKGERQMGFCWTGSIRTPGKEDGRGIEGDPDLVRAAEEEEGEGQGRSSMERGWKLLSLRVPGGRCQAV